VLIRTYGLFWRTDEIDWKGGHGRKDEIPPSAMLGMQGSFARHSTLRVSDFRDQRGLYILYGDYGPRYAGLAIDRGIASRLRDHMFNDRHKGLWDRFSWYGFRTVRKRPNTLGLCDLEPTMAETRKVVLRQMIHEMEALLIHGLGVQNIHKEPFPQGEEWMQLSRAECAFAQPTPGRLQPLPTRIVLPKETALQFGARTRTSRPRTRRS
jgi:hypothetical protein